MSHQLDLAAREHELGLLGERYERSLIGGPQMVLLEAERGLGKSTLLAAFADALRHRKRPRPHVVSLTPPADGTPYEPVTHAALATDRRMYARLAGQRQGRVVPTSLLAEWLGAIPGWGDLAGAVATTAEALRRRKKAAMLPTAALRDEGVEAIHLQAVHTPVVLLLDDLNRAAPGQLDRLARLIGAGGDAAVFVAATTLAARGSTCARLRRAIGLDRLIVRTLPPFDAGAVRRLVRHAAPATSDELVARIMDITGGHPGALREALDELVACPNADPEHLLSTLQAAGTVVPSLPPDFERVPADVLPVLEAAASLDTFFQAAQVAEALGRPELAVEDHLAVAVHLDCLVPAGEDTLASGEVTSRYRFPAPHHRVAVLARARHSRKATSPAALPAEHRRGSSP